MIPRNDYGSGDRYFSGKGHGYGLGDGAEFIDGYGYGDDNGYGNGYGYGDDNGYGNGYGYGSWTTFSGANGDGTCFPEYDDSVVVLLKDEEKP